MVPKKKRPSSGYTGILAEPIILPDHHKRARKAAPRGPWFKSHQSDAIDTRVASEARQRKLPHLFKYFGIDPNRPDAGALLAVSLAIKHVPGFRTHRATGAPNKIGVKVLCHLYRYANLIQARRKYRPRKLTAEAICKALKGDKIFSAAIPELADLSVKRLQNLLSTARLMRKARIGFTVRACILMKASAGDVHLEKELPIRLGDPPIWYYDRSE